MRFVRLQADGDDVPTGLEAVAGAGDLDFVQIDYPRPRMAPAVGAEPPEFPEFAAGFSTALRVLGKPLFLEPELRVVASAGWSNAYACVEAAARVLVAAGCGELPVSAVRGSNLLPILDMLAAEGVDLRHAETGQAWRELREPLVAADLQMGAGPLAAALAEGGRVVVAGCYDDSSPAAAAAVGEYGWSWGEYDRLAGAAAAARAAGWLNWAPCDASASVDDGADTWRPHVVELDAAGPSIVELPRPCSEGAAGDLHQWLTGAGRRLTHADVICDMFGLQSSAETPHRVRLAGVAGAVTDAHWRLDVLYQSGFAAEALLEFTASTNGRVRKQVAAAIRAQLHVADDATGLLTIEELQSGAGGIGWLHLAYQSKNCQSCQRFVDQTLRWVTAHRAVVRLAGGRPAVHVHYALWPARVPRDAVDIAVETRTAREWE